jgi:hypothetical protein
MQIVSAIQATGERRGKRAPKRADFWEAVLQTAHKPQFCGISGFFCTIRFMG